MASADEQLLEVVNGHGAALRRLARVYTRDGADAEDLFQEICLAIWRALPSFRGECSIRTFVFRIGHNRGLSHRARQRPEPYSFDQVPEPVDQQLGPEGVTAAGFRRDRLLAAVRALPPPHQQVVLLSLEGLGNREIAEILGTTENNVAVRLTRSRKQLREWFSARGGIE